MKVKYVRIIINKITTIHNFDNAQNHLKMGDVVPISA